MPRRKKLKCVRIDWIDASGNGNWSEGELNIIECVTVGVLLEQDREQVRVALSLAPNHKRDSTSRCCHVMAIPRKGIVRMKTFLA